MKNYSDTIGNRTRDLPACSAVSQPTASPGAPQYKNSGLENSDSIWGPFVGAWVQDNDPGSCLRTGSVLTRYATISFSRSSNGVRDILCHVSFSTASFPAGCLYAAQKAVALSVLRAQSTVTLSTTLHNELTSSTRMRSLQLLIACRACSRPRIIIYNVFPFTATKREIYILQARNSELHPAPPYRARPHRGVSPISPEPRLLQTFILHLSRLARYVGTTAENLTS